MTLKTLSRSGAGSLQLLQTVQPSAFLRTWGSWLLRYLFVSLSWFLVKAVTNVSSTRSEYPVLPPPFQIKVCFLSSTFLFLRLHSIFWNLQILQCSARLCSTIYTKRKNENAHMKRFQWSITYQIPGLRNCGEIEISEQLLLSIFQQLKSL